MRRSRKPLLHALALCLACAFAHGTIQGFGGNGVILGPGGIVERVRAWSNLVGIDVLRGEITVCFASSNATSGIRAGVDLWLRGIVERVRARSNGDGIRATDGEVAFSLVTGNAGNGIVAIDTVLRSNISRENGVGIDCDGGNAGSCPIYGNFVTNSSAASIIGGFLILGLNRICDATGTDCQFY